MSVRKTYDVEHEMSKVFRNEINKIQEKNVHLGSCVESRESPEEVGRRQSPRQMVSLARMRWAQHGKVFLLNVHSLRLLP